MHYGNQNSKRFMLVVIVILFIGGFIKGMYKSTQKKETVASSSEKGMKCLCSFLWNKVCVMFVEKDNNEDDKTIKDKSSTELCNKNLASGMLS